MTGTDAAVVVRRVKAGGLAWSPRRAWSVVDGAGRNGVRRPAGGRSGWALVVSLLVHGSALMLVLSTRSPPFRVPAEPGIQLVFEPVPMPSVPDVAAPPADLKAVEISPMQAPPEIVAPARTAQPAPVLRPAPAVSAEPAGSPQRLPDAPRPAPQGSRAAATPRRPARKVDPVSPARPFAPEAAASHPGGEAPVIPPSPVAGMEMNRPPAYPAAALRRREQGRVMVRVRVAADGTLTDVDVAETSGHPNLDAAALTAVRQWRFTPATQAGRPVSAVAEVPVRFSLDN